MPYKALFLFVWLVCPWVYAYGQLHVSSVNGEKGYAAMRGSYVLDLDNGFVLHPSGGYYRMSDKEEDDPGATGKAALAVEYAWNDNLTLSLDGHYVPRRLGFKAAGYGAGAQYTLCYRCGPLKYPYMRVHVGQTFYSIYAHYDGQQYPRGFSSTANTAWAEWGSEVGKFFIQARYDKVIKYSNKPPDTVRSHWTDIPFMTAVMQGFVRDIAAARVAYRTPWLTPYGVYARYKYLARSEDTISVAGGLALHVGQTTLSGGVEIFEQNQKQNRKTYFSVAASTEF